MISFGAVEPPERTWLLRWLVGLQPAGSAARADRRTGAGRLPGGVLRQRRQTACSTALQDSLKQALTVTPEQLYGAGACVTDPSPRAGTPTRRG